MANKEAKKYMNKYLLMIGLSFVIMGTASVSKAEETVWDDTDTTTEDVVHMTLDDELEENVLPKTEPLAIEKMPVKEKMLDLEKKHKHKVAKLKEEHKKQAKKKKAKKEKSEN
jgi:hypothetical protein